MLTIKNIEKINGFIAFNCWSLTHDTHYVFYLEPYGKATKPIEITLSRFKVSELYGSGHPHTNPNEYLLLANGSYQKWISSESIKDMGYIVNSIIELVDQCRF